MVSQNNLERSFGLSFFLCCKIKKIFYLSKQKQMNIALNEKINSLSYTQKTYLCLI
jgi:hypothetical protein